MSLVALQPWVPGALGGYSDRIDIVDAGSGRPGGVENQLEYNGARFNNRGWLDTVMVTSIDGLADADVRDARENNPDDHGETAFDAFYGGRTIVLTGKIRAMTLNKLRVMQMALRQAFAELTEKPLIFHTVNPDNDVMIYCRKSQPITMAETQGNYEFTRDFQIGLRASDPRFLSANLKSALSSALASSTTNQSLYTAFNAGNFDATPTIRINGPLTVGTYSGAPMTLRLYSYPAGSSTLYGEMFLNGALVSGHYLIIDTLRHTIKEYDATNAFVANRYEMVDPTSTWFRLSPGNSGIYADTYSTGGGTVLFEWRDTYM